MNIYSWNVNGLRSAAKKGFADWFSSTKPDILCLQEVRAEEDQIDEAIAHPEGYFAYWNACKRKKGYSGVGVLSQIEPDRVNYGFDIEEFDDEGRVLQLVFPDWVLNCIYFPNGGSGDDRLDYKLRFYDAFLENSKRWLDDGKHVVTVGDYNTCHKEIDIARPKENADVSGFLPIERAWMDKYVENGFVDSFRKLHPETKDVYSWWSNRFGARARNVGWRIDYAFVDAALVPNIVSAEIHTDVKGSDHCPISIELEPPFAPLPIKKNEG
ncbi:exodeoxyribonuclease III [Fibrobacter sp. HC4]|uniref:exodeoxyribonuclease III n=1 Tax=Fibrobacter sp. HC4 TaxID=3239812 RepID=UPI002019C33F|nr:exodeoxyribonuclease III [Fibrobacter succinogenes]MCL4102346.1 Exodeoxyribonuclease [Fibrobacter succinogenes]